MPAARHARHCCVLADTTARVKNYSLSLSVAHWNAATMSWSLTVPDRAAHSLYKNYRCVRTGKTSSRRWLIICASGGTWILLASHYTALVLAAILRCVRGVRASAGCMYRG